MKNSPDCIIRRDRELAGVREKMASAPVTAILGPRQCGKTTLARMLDADHYFDLENPRDAARLAEPQLALEGLIGTVVIDEIQRVPELFPLLRYLTDTQSRTRYLVLGSASPDLLRHGSESLAGRLAFHDLGPFAIDELAPRQSKTLWVRGGFPRSVLARDERESVRWREDFIRTFLERDIPLLGISVPAHTLRRFWVMISHYHGQLLNLSELARSFGVSDNTVRRYLEILAGTYMIRLLPPWHANVGKRLVRAPKLYIRDSGLFHSLQTVEDASQLEVHPKLGASWEGFALEQAIRLLGIRDPYFWRTHTGAELDLFWRAGGRSWGMELKYADAPGLSRSLHSVLEDLSPEHLWVLYPGKEQYKLHERVTVLPLAGLAGLEGTGLPARR